MLLAFGLPIVLLGGGVLVILMAMYQRTRTLEMKHRERMAMIERGLVPGPEKDPAAFETWQNRHDNPPGRTTSIGVVAVAIGFGLMLLISFAGGDPRVGVGVGGAIVMLGLASVVNGEIQRRSQPRRFVDTPPLNRVDPSGPSVQ